MAVVERDDGRLAGRRILCHALLADDLAGCRQVQPGAVRAQRFLAQRQGEAAIGEGKRRPGEPVAAAGEGGVLQAARFAPTAAAIGRPAVNEQIPAERRAALVPQVQPAAFGMQQRPAGPIDVGEGAGGRAFAAGDDLRRAPAVAAAEAEPDRRRRVGQRVASQPGGGQAAVGEFAQAGLARFGGAGRQHFAAELCRQRARRCDCRRREGRGGRARYAPAGGAQGGETAGRGQPAPGGGRQFRQGQREGGRGGHRQGRQKFAPILPARELVRCLPVIPN